MTKGSFIVADFGKTFSKLTLWTRDGRLLDQLKRPNATIATNHYAALDVAANEAWLVESLRRFAAHPIEAIIPISHGAAVTGLSDDRLAFPPLDYEEDVPADIARTYQAQRDPFAVTGSPSYSQGLNMGQQLHWLEHLHGSHFSGAVLLPYAQYWAWVLSGSAVTEISSLGCHTDLWAPYAGTFSPLASRRSWAQQFAPIARAGDCVGRLRANLAALTGLSPQVQVYAGAHDSNAALVAARGYPEIEGQDASLLSTGTWFVAMRTLVPGTPLPAMDEARDCLTNIDVKGVPVPSARFMGGREIATLVGAEGPPVEAKPMQPRFVAATASVLTNGVMILPTFASGFGPFPANAGYWKKSPIDWEERGAAICLYAALVAERSLSLIGAQGRLLVEGRFGAAEVFTRALASLCPDLQIFKTNSQIDASFGALRMIDPSIRPYNRLERVHPLEHDLSTYRAHWEEALG